MASCRLASFTASDLATSVSPMRSWLRAEPCRAKQDVIGTGPTSNRTENVWAIPMMIAYIDPATGAMVMQIIAAGVLAGGVFFRKVLLAPVAFLFKKNTPAEVTDG